MVFCLYSDKDMFSMIVPPTCDTFGTFGAEARSVLTFWPFDFTGVHQQQARWMRDGADSSSVFWWCSSTTVYLATECLRILFDVSMNVKDTGRAYLCRCMYEYRDLGDVCML